MKTADSHPISFEYHTLPPLFDDRSKILILGSFPSVASRAAGFYYGHPHNRFWAVLAGVLHCETPNTVEEKKALLFCHRIALWDVAASCNICGSSDGSIKNVSFNDLSLITSIAPVEHIFLNGAKADSLLKGSKQYPLSCTRLPSTSPANAAWSLERLIVAWSKIASFLN